MKHFPKLFLPGLTLCLALVAFSASAAEAWSELSKPDTIVLFRHATAPGIGDPTNFKLNDCSTQRNLNVAGRAEARKLGEQFRSRKIPVGAVLTSQWCRTRETALLAFGQDAVRDELAFNSSFLASSEISNAQTSQARSVLMGWRGPGVLIVVTHQVNITALTGVNPSSAEGVVLRLAGDGSLTVVGTIAS